ncbi:MAG TPA: S1 RNA-binding domain-containing protein [Polyangiales bacterium]|nr:S1 RNA-binding domain-containing protein [Polyangiales bacterium]
MSAEPSSAATGEDAADDASDANEEGGEEASAEGAAPGDPARKKRRRRRRKKPGAQAAEGAEGGESQGEGAGGKPERPHREPREGHREGAGGVFARFFDGPSAGKRHAFSAGEVVAGRVVKINDGAFVVDLFGKATAFVDVFEPHEVPTVPEPPPPAPSAEAVARAEGEGLPPAPAEGAEAPVEGVDAPIEGTVTAGEISALGESSAAAAAESNFGEQPASDVGDSSTEVVRASTPPEEPVASVSAEQVDVPNSEGSYGHAAATSAFGEQPEEAHAEASSEEQPEEEHHEGEEAEPEPEAPPPPELGTIFRGRIGSVAESGHVVLVNRIVDVQAAKQRIVNARESRQRVRGVVYGFNRGGFDVLVEGVRVFCPASGMSLGPLDNPELQLGQRLEFTVPPAKAGTHGLVVSRRGILERQQRKAAKQLFRSLSPGQRLKGRVTQVREFGLFVDLGGFEGLVHQSELSFSRGVRPQDVAQPGDELEVQVLRVGEGQTRKERERVSLSLKTLQADPWSEHTALLEPGSIVTGKVVRTTEFGAFIELAPQIEGLLHISELGRDLKHANQALEEGSELQVVVERVDRKARRISLSKLSQAEQKSLAAGVDAKSARPPKPGASVTVVVDKIEHAGLLVQVPGVFGRRGRGFIPNVEMGTERGTDHRRGFPPGTEILAKVIGVDRDGGFRFSRKALLVDEEKRAVQDYRREAARQGLGTFGDLLRAKLEGKTNS